MTYILDVFEDVFHSMFSDSSHGKCLTTTSLPICKNCCCQKNNVEMLEPAKDLLAHYETYLNLQVTVHSCKCR